MTTSIGTDHEISLLQMANRLSRTGAWRWDIIEDSVIWTEMLYEIFEVPLGEPVDLSKAMRSHTPDSQRRISAAIDRCLADRTPYDLRLEFVMPSGRNVWAQAQGRAEVDNAGTVVALYGSFRDITPEVVAERARADAQTELAFVTENMPDGFFLLDDDWTFIFVNPASRGMLRHEPEELIGRNLWEKFPQAVGSTFWDRYHEVRDTRKSTRFVEYFAPLDIWFEVAAHPARKGIAVHFRDVSDRVAERQDLRLFRTAVEMLGAGVLIIDGLPAPLLDRKIVYANDAALTSLRQPRDRVIGERLTDLLSEAPDGATFRDYAARVDAGAIAIEEFLGRTPDGEERVLNCIAAPLLDDEGAISHVVMILDDMTERRLAERVAKRSERLALLGQMAGGVSHDFNNLLAVIMGNIELLELTADPEEARQLRNEAIDAVKRGKTLNDSLLAFAGRAHIAPKVEDLPGFVTSIEALLRRAVPSSVAFDFVLSSNLPPVMLDMAMAESCLLNLVINAREAVEGDGTITVTVFQTLAVHPLKPDRMQERWIALSVADDGVGIPQALQDQVFDPFFTTRGVGEGSGLGLSRVRGYVEQLGGFVTLDSEPDRGTTVTLHFPVAAVDDRSASPAPPPATAAGTGRVLVVDDTPAVARITQRLLESIGYTVVGCHDSDAAEKAFDRDGPFTHLVTDVIMPGRAGTELAASLRSRDPDLRVLLISGYPETETLANGLADSVVFVPKPVTRAKLAETMASLG